MLPVSLIISAFISFAVAAFGYILARFWVVPIVRYRRARKRSLRSLAVRDRASNPMPSSTSSGTLDINASLRQSAAALVAIYNDRLPEWYKLLLSRRGESPLEAARDMMALANTRDHVHAAGRIEKIRKALLKDKPGR